MAKPPEPRHSASSKPVSSGSGASPSTTRAALGRDSSSAGDRFPLAVVVVILILAVWLARFWYSADFGVYEDDPPRVVPAIEGPWSKIFGLIWTIVSGFGGQGRPLCPSFIYAFSYWSGRVAGLQGAYWLGALIVSFNAVLLYSLLKKVTGRQLIALPAALAFTVFPADATQGYLTMSFCGQPSIAIFLVTAHCYFSRWRPLSYLLALGSLVCYETVFPLFLALPLMEEKWDKSLLKRFLWQGMFVGGSLAGMALIRKAVGEGFVSSLTLRSALTRPFEQMAIGPVTSMAMFFYRPWNSLPREFAAYWQFLVPIFVGLVIVLGLLSSRWGSAGRQPLLGRRLGKLALAGLVLLVMAYPLTFTVDAATIDGRDTRVHLAAAIGGAVLWGCLCAFLLSRSRGSWLRFPAVTVLAMLFTGMFAFGFNIQRDYRLAWEYQRGFWTDVTRSCPDLGRDTVILVEEKGLKEVRQINPWGWDMPYTFTKNVRHSRSLDADAAALWAKGRLARRGGTVRQSTGWRRPEGLETREVGESDLYTS